MSNPAVITLDDVSSKKGIFKRFTIEDNIGESIHLHIDNMRIDFTIEEFLEFSQMIRKSLIELDFLDGYSVENFDAHFLKECSVFFDKFINITIEEIKISDLQCIEHIKFKNRIKLMKLTAVDNIPAFRYLNGDKKDFINYSQYNYFNLDNEKRLLSLVDSIKNNGYPYNEQYIILFNGQNIVRDGQHRVAVLAHLYGLDYKIKVMRFNFKGNKHFLRVYKHNILVVTRFIAKKTYYKLKKIKSYIK